MSELRELYQEVILDHNKKPRNCYKLDCPNHFAHGHNPLCGDQVDIFVKIRDRVVEEVSFQGKGCAICTASCSMMTESVKGKSVEEARELFDQVHELLTGAIPPDAELGKLRVFEGVRAFPVRVKCATLAWHTLNTALDTEIPNPCGCSAQNDAQVEASNTKEDALKAPANSEPAEPESKCQCDGDCGDDCQCDGDCDCDCNCKEETTSQEADSKCKCGGDCDGNCDCDDDCDCDCKSEEQAPKEPEKLDIPIQNRGCGCSGCDC